MDAGLLIDVGNVGAHGVNGERQVSSNAWNAFAAEELLKEVLFARCELVASGNARCYEFRRLVVVGAL